jgi:hypothetical protein
MTDHTDSVATQSLRRTARISGALYLIIIVAGIFAFFFVRGSLVVPGDAATTAANVAASEGLFRVGLAADLIMLLSDVAIAAAFFVLLRPVSMGLSLLAAFFRLVQASVLGANLLNLIVGLQLAKGDGYLASVSGQSESLALLFFDLHAIGYTLALAFFGVSILVVGYLVIKANYFPSILGVLLMVAGAGYLADTVANLLLPNYADYAAIFTAVVFAPAFIGELAMALYLLIKGVRSEPPAENADLATPAEGQYA